VVESIGILADPLGIYFSTDFNIKQEGVRSSFGIIFLHSKASSHPLKGVTIRDPSKSLWVGYDYVGKKFREGKVNCKR